jgi:hypothetical protein
LEFGRRLFDDEVLFAKVLSSIQVRAGGLQIFDENTKGRKPVINAGCEQRWATLINAEQR